MRRKSLHRNGFACIFLLGPLLANPFAAAAPVELQSGNPIQDGAFGVFLQGVPDLTSDGVDDILVGASGETVNGLEGAGRVYAYNSATGALIVAMTSPQPQAGAGFGSLLTWLPDKNSDGFVELVSVEFAREGETPFVLWILNGQTGARMRKITGTGISYAGSLATVPDVNEDGVDDIALGGVFIETTPPSFSAVLLYDPTTGLLIRRMGSPGGQTTTSPGQGIAGLPDMNDDGTGDVLLGAFYDSANDAIAAGRVYLYNGGDGDLLLDIASPNPEANGQFGWSVSGVPDITGDGLNEILVGARGEATYAGRAYLFDGVDGTLLQTFTAPTPGQGDFFGSKVLGFSAGVDGVANLLAIAAERESNIDLTGGSYYGRVYLYGAQSGVFLDSLVSPSYNSGTGFGEALAALTNGNQYALAVGAPGEMNATGIRAGRAFVLTPANTFEGEWEGEGEGEGEGAGEGEGEGEGEDPNRFTGLVSVEVTQVDDVAAVYLDGARILESAWGMGENGIDIGHLPGYAGEVDITDLLSIGQHELRFIVWNAAACCGVSGFMTVRAGSTVLYDDGIEVQDSTMGIKFDDTFAFTWLGSGAQTEGEPVSVLTRYFTLDASGGQGGGASRDPAWPVYPEGRTVTVQGIPVRGYRFTHWSGPDAADLSDTLSVTATIVMDADKEVMANFEEDPQPEGEGENRYAQCLLKCANAVDAAGADNDGDGLSVCVEDCLGTSDQNIDTDNDGLPDNFEAAGGLNPLQDDSGTDPDGNGLSFLSEYLVRVAALVGSTGVTEYYVSSEDGQDVPGAGAQDSPWASIGYALSQVNPSLGNAVHIVLEDGIYLEDVQLLSHTAITGRLGSIPTIVGAVTGAHLSALGYLRIQAPAPPAGQVIPTETPVLLLMDDARMWVKGVLFEGTNLRAATGIVTSGEAPDESVIEACGFTTLGVGIDILGRIPKIRRCVFQELLVAGVILRRDQIATVEGALSDRRDSGSGWNTFSRTIVGPAIINERTGVLRMENNDWDTDDPAEIEAKIEGDADYEPALAAGSGLLAGAIFCTVWDANTQVPILDATISLTPSSYNPVTENQEGVYSFPAITEGQYTTSATAPGYKGSAIGVAVGSGELASVIIPLTSAGVEGEGEGATPPPPPPGCNCAKAGVQTPSPADAFLGTLSFLVLLVLGTPGLRRRN